jgi:hypothetical protein
MAGAETCIPASGRTLHLNRLGRRNPSAHHRISHLQMTRPALFDRLERHIGDNDILEVLGDPDFAARRDVQIDGR